MSITRGRICACEQQYVFTSLHTFFLSTRASHKTAAGTRQRKNLLCTHNPPTIHPRHFSLLLGNCPSWLEFLPTPWQAFTNGLGCTLLQHPTSPALLTSPTLCQSELVYGTCIGTAQIGTSLVTPLGFIFKQSSLCSLRDMIIIS